jgi:hypothetical protein
MCFMHALFDACGSCISNSQHAWKKTTSRARVNCRGDAGIIHRGSAQDSVFHQQCHAGPLPRDSRQNFHHQRSDGFCSSVGDCQTHACSADRSKGMYLFKQKGLKQDISVPIELGRCLYSIPHHFCCEQQTLPRHPPSRPQLRTPVDTKLS